jgi:uncharacterized membrane protein (DUF106 family)
MERKSFDYKIAQPRKHVPHPSRNEIILYALISVVIISILGILVIQSNHVKSLENKVAELQRMLRDRAEKDRGSEIEDLSKRIRDLEADQIALRRFQSALRPWLPFLQQIPARQDNGSWRGASKRPAGP